MRYLTTQKANTYLCQVGMQIGDWNQLTEVATLESGESSWINFQAPKGAQELLNFSQHVAGWLPKGAWKIFQVDNSCSLDAVQMDFVGRLIRDSELVRKILERRTWIFEFGNDVNADASAELCLSNLIYSFLLFESHGYAVSSGGSARQYLAIQDGFVYFYSNEEGIEDVKRLLKDFENDPLVPPQWILGIIIETQERDL